MIHLGNITKISGYTAPIVDCIIGGSPCQDLSVAGKRAGLEGERSGLYMEQIRITKEMRERDKRNGRTGVDIRPRYMVWENVPGALFSGTPKGEDFRIVLEELAKIADKDAVIPMPPNGKWTSCGCIVGDGFSIAWRILDAQFWGVPQRRRRIALVADFGGQSAPEILFVSKGVSGHSDEGKQKRKGIASDAQGGIGADHRKGIGFDGYNGVLMGVVYENHSQDSRYKELGDVSETVSAKYGTGGNNQPLVVSCYSKQKRAQSATDNETWVESDTANTLNAFDVGDVRTTEAVVYALDRAPYNQGKNAQFDFEISDKGINSSLVAKGPSAVAYVDTSHADDVVRMDDTVAPLQARDYKGGKLIATRYIVRRLTPLECERLQGFPDGWTDIGEWVDSKGKRHQTSDAARYKALGNSISLPNWKWILKRLCACYERDATMASLFDGIGGFPYLWEKLNGKGTCLWASEIEDFPIAVTKARIGGDT